MPRFTTRCAIARFCEIIGIVDFDRVITPDIFAVANKIHDVNAVSWVS
jgi:hypothetical protein